MLQGTLARCLCPELEQRFIAKEQNARVTSVPPVSFQLKATKTKGMLVQVLCLLCFMVLPFFRPSLGSYFHHSVPYHTLLLLLLPHATAVAVVAFGQDTT